MSYKNVTANCGCVVEMDLSHDWESGVTDAEDVSIISLCDKHSASTLTALLKEAGEALKPFEIMHNNTSDSPNRLFSQALADILKPAVEVRKKIQEVLP